MRKSLILIVMVIIALVVGNAFAIDIAGTAKAIKAGKINVGKTTGMEQGKRFHNIHNKALGLQCQSCHISGFAPDYSYQKKYKDIGGMGHVDRGICLGCHKENGPAVTKLYGTAER
ncbi:MAG: hypothetical protein ACK4TF_02185 [Thermodesulfovibrionales bacterium]